MSGDNPYLYNSSCIYPRQSPISQEHHAAMLPLHVYRIYRHIENVSGSCTFNWSVDPVTNVTGATGMLRDHTALFNDVGLYTVSHSVSCMAGSDTEDKNRLHQCDNHQPRMSQPRSVQLMGQQATGSPGQQSTLTMLKMVRGRTAQQI